MSSKKEPNIITLIESKNNSIQQLQPQKYFLAVFCVYISLYLILFLELN